MRMTLRSCLILAFLGTTTSIAAAQQTSQPRDVTGIWTGTMTHGSGTDKQTWTIELDVAESAVGVVGTTTIIAGDATAVFELRGQRSNGSISTNRVC